VTAGTSYPRLAAMVFYPLRWLSFGLVSFGWQLGTVAALYDTPSPPDQCQQMIGRCKLFGRFSGTLEKPCGRPDLQPMRANFVFRRSRAPGGRVRPKSMLANGLARLEPSSSAAHCA
jgi:hypothetical protein